MELIVPRSYGFPRGFDRSVVAIYSYNVDSRPGRSAKPCNDSFISQVFIPVGTLTVLLCEFLLLSSSFVLACYVALPFDPTIFLVLDSGWVRLLVVVFSLLVGLHFPRSFLFSIRVQSRIVLLQQLCMVVGVGLLFPGLHRLYRPQFARSYSRDGAGQFPFAGGAVHVAGVLFRMSPYWAIVAANAC